MIALHMLDSASFCVFHLIGGMFHTHADIYIKTQESWDCSYYSKLVQKDELPPKENT